MEATDVNHIVKNFTSTFLGHVSECIPEETIVTRPSDKPWFDSILRREIRIRNRLWRKHKNQIN